MNIDCNEKLFLSGTHTVAIANGAEKYETIAESFADAFRDVIEIIEDGHITIEEENVSVEIFLSGDYKVISPLSHTFYLIETKTASSGWSLQSQDNI